MRIRNFSRGRTRRSGPTCSGRRFSWVSLYGPALLVLALLVSTALWRRTPVSAARGADSPTAEAAKEAVRVRAAGRGNPVINLSDGHDLNTAYREAAQSEQAPADHLSEPAALASADFDEDGTPDLIASYRGATGGMIALHRGNVDSIFPNSPDAKQRKATGEFTDSPFLPTARVFDIPNSPDLLGVGDFDADGHFDVVTATRGGDALYFVQGDGHGGFGSAKRIELPGRVTAMVTGEINRADGLTDVVVGLVGADGPKVLVFEGPEGALRAKPEIIPLPGEAAALALGKLSDGYEMDLAVAAGNELVIVHGRDRKLSLDDTQQASVPPPQLERQTVPFLIRSIELGHFVSDETHSTDIALLADDGTVHFATKVSVTEEARTNQSRDGSQDEWQVKDLLTASWPMATQLIKAKVSSLPTDDLIVADSLNSQLHIVSQGSVINSDGLKQQAGATSGQWVADPQITTLDVDSAPEAVLPMRLNSDALNDLVILRKGRAAPVVVMTAPTNTFTVNSAGDEPDADPNDGICSDCQRDANQTCKRDSNNKIILNNVCSLRGAITQANASTGSAAIVFNIGSGAQTISPNSGYPAIYPNPVTIDGTTQPGFAGSPIIELNGAGAGSADGLFISAGACTVRGLAINRFSGNGLELTFLGGNQVQGNYIGLDVTGTIAKGNSKDGIRGFNTPNTVIGGTTAAARNVITGNGGDGIHLDPGAAGISIKGNYLGTDATGTKAPGGLPQLAIRLLTTNNTVGGTEAGAGNVVSGNLGGGVQIQDGNASGNNVQGNFIGTNAAGTTALGNSGNALFIANAPNNLIGGTTANARNIISASGDGLKIGNQAGQNNATNNLVQGNFIGTDVTGTVGLGNKGFSGVTLFGSASGNTIGGTAAGARNVISDNANGGVSVFGAATSNNVVQGNYIGTDVSGTVGLGNHGSGVTLEGANNLFGGSAVGARNVVSGNFDVGFDIDSVGTNNNKVQGNFIGTDASGTKALGNLKAGVFVGLGAQSNTIGGTVAGAGNLISGNNGDGILLKDPGTTGNFVQGNLVGTDVNGTARLGNTNHGVEIDGAPQNDIGGNAAGGARNVISGNSGNGVEITNAGPGDNSARFISIQGNFIGTQVDGVSALGNGADGVGIYTSAGNNTIGGAVAGLGNTIAFNGGAGVRITTSINNNIQRNSIYNNAKLGIDLGPQGVTLNDADCSRDGANHLRNFPILGAPVVGSDGNTKFQVSLQCRPNMTYRIDFYSNDMGDPSNHGQGKTFLFDRTVTTDNQGGAAFVFTSAGPLPAGTLVSATATDPDGNTSEFSCLDGKCCADVPAGAQMSSAKDSSSGLIPAATFCLKPYVVNVTTDDDDALPGDHNCQTDLNDPKKPCSLRAAITEAVNDGGNTIKFNIPASDPNCNSTTHVCTIGPRKPLPDISQSITIDATTQPGFSVTPFVELRAASNIFNGLKVTGSGNSSIVRGLAINRFFDNGILIQDASNVVVESCFIGTDATGLAAAGNGVGVRVQNASNNRIGGTSPKSRNLISGNNQAGILILSTSSNDASNNLVQGNFIGTTLDGNTRLPNQPFGISIADSHDNKIGGSDPGAGNVVSGNGQTGIGIANSSPSIDQAHDNVISGNFIGIGADGKTPVFNGIAGVVLSQGARNNIIGHTGGGGNVISGNKNAQAGGFGIGLNLGSHDNQIIGNFIGTDVSGRIAVPNLSGIILVSGANANVIGGATSAFGNLISGNAAGGGVFMATNLTAPPSSAASSTSEPLSIGTSVKAWLLKISTLVPIDNASKAKAAAVVKPLDNGPTRANQVLGNGIGVTVDGFEALPNSPFGVGVFDGSSKNAIGMPGAGNIISGNNGTGVFLGNTAGTGTLAPSGNSVQANYIGTDLKGFERIANLKGGIFIQDSPNNLIGGFGTDIPLARNVISANLLSGVEITGAASSGNRVSGNYIGTAKDGTSALGNALAGVAIHGGARHNIIGGTEQNAGNTIAFNKEGVVVFPDAGCCNPTDPNSIFNNIVKGIDLGCTSSPPSDQEATDLSACSGMPLPNGPNNRQNFPEFASAMINASGDLILQYKVDSVPGNSNYGANGIHVEFFKADAKLQGQSFIGSTNYTVADYNNGKPGVATFNAGNATTLGVQAGDKIVATATSADGNTSEFTSTNVGTVASASTTTIQFSSPSYSVTKGDPNNPRVNITVTRAGDTTGSASVGYSTIDDAGLQNCNVFNGIASPRCDYENTIGTMTFAAGETSKSFSVAIVADSYAKGNITFRVALSGPSSATLGSTSIATVTIIDNPAVDGPHNPIDNTEFFVRQQYLDFLGREPDPIGGPAWISIINGCAPNDTTCDRIHVSQNFFQSPEFQGRGYFIYRFYPVSFPNVSGSDPAGYGHKPDYMQFVPDLARVSGFLTDAQLEAAKVAFIADFMARPAFANTYNGLTNTQYVDMLLSNANAGIGASTRQGWIDGLNNSSLTRAQVLRQIAESTEVYNKYYNPAFAIMEYFGYLRRDPDGAYLVWVQVLNQTNDSRGMITGFVNSNEYKQRFGP